MSIWEVKRGRRFFVHRNSAVIFPAIKTCRKKSSFGSFRTMGLFKKVTEVQEALAIQNGWILFDLEVRPRWASILRLFAGKPNAGLTCPGALIKQPELLILERSSQGWMIVSTSPIQEINVQQICERSNNHPDLWWVTCGRTCGGGWSKWWSWVWLVIFLEWIANWKW